MSGAAPSDARPGVRELLVTGLIATLVTAVAVFLLFGPRVFVGSRLFFTHEIYASDFWHVNYAFRSFYADGLADGRLPLWCPDLGLGYPLLADGQLGALYPPNLVLYSILPLAAALNLEILGHLVLAGAFAAMFTRNVGAGRGGSALAGVVYGLAGFFLVHLKHANMIVAGAWFPAILLLMARYAGSRRAGTLALLALAVGLTALGGHPQVAYYDFLLAAFFGAGLLVLAARRPRERGGGTGSAIRLGAGLGAAAVLGLALAAPQLLPARELAERGPRKAGLSDDDATRFDYRLRDLAGFVSPTVYGDPGVLEEVPYVDPETGRRLVKLQGYEPAAGGNLLFWEMTAYVGILPLILALLALGWARPRGPPAALAALLVLALVLALGRGAGLFDLFRKIVPGFDLFRFPSRFLLYADFALAVLAGLGLSVAARRIGRGRPRLARIAIPLAVLVCIVDVGVSLGDHNPQVEPSKWLRRPPLARRIDALEGEDGTPFRILTIDPHRHVFRNAYRRARGWKGDLSPYEPAWNNLAPNLALLFGLNQLFVDSPVSIRWVQDVTHMVLLPPRRPEGPPGGVHPVIAAMLNVRYFIDPFGAIRGGLEPIAVFQGDLFVTQDPFRVAETPYTIRLYLNPVELPRAFLVPRARWLPDPDGREGVPSLAAEAVLAPGFDPRLEVVVSGGEPLGNSATGPAAPLPDRVEILEYSPHLVRIRADAPQEAWLFLSDAFYPGWVATVDGREAPIRRANIAGRAVKLGAGRHEVVFSYRPASFRRGLAASAGALAILVLLVLTAGRSRAGRARNVPPSPA